MKYIRTKDGRIYDTLDERGMAISQTRKQCDFVDFVTFQNRLGDFAIPKTEIIKQADTIEELCDEFVLIRNETIRVYPKLEQLLEAITAICIGDNVYGAIWTEWGLKYVAKMNKKGELELL